MRKRSFKILLKDIGLIVYDFDGVLTDNRVILREDGTESVIVSRSDGLAAGIINGLGVKQLIMTTEKNPVAIARGRKLRIPVKCGIDNKKTALLSYCRQRGIPLKSVVYIGNDINDLEAMKAVGYPVCPSDAYREIKTISKIVLGTAGGSGVVRNFLSYIKL